MNSLRGKFGSYSTPTSRGNSGDISNLSLRELMAEEFPVDPFLERRKLLPLPVSKPFIDDKPRRPETRDYPLYNQRDSGTLSLTEYANSFYEASRSEDPRRYGGSFAHERLYPDRGSDRQFQGMNNSRSGEMYGSVGNRGHPDRELKGVNNSHYGEMYGSVGNRGHPDRGLKGVNNSHYGEMYGNRGHADQGLKGVNNSHYGEMYGSLGNRGHPDRGPDRELKGVNNSHYGEMYSSYGNGGHHRNSKEEQFRSYEREVVNKEVSGGINLSEYVKKLFTEDEFSNIFTTNSRKEEKKAVEDLHVLQDTAVGEIPVYVKNLLEKVLSRDRIEKQESVVSPGTGEANRSQSEDKTPKPDLADYVQMLYARIESDREKIQKYQDLLKQGPAKEENTESEKNPGETSTQPSEIGTKQSNEPASGENMRPEKSRGNVATAQPAEEEPSKEVDTSSDCIVIEEVVAAKPPLPQVPLPRPPQFPSLTGLLHREMESESSIRDYHHPQRGLKRKSPTKSRSRSPRRYRRKSLSRSPPPPREVRSRSPKEYRHRSRSPKKSKTSSISSNTLVGALKLVISAIKRTNTNYSLDMLQDDVSVDFFHLPSALKVSVLVCGFQLKLSTSPSAHGYHWSMLRDVLEFSQGCELNPEVYVEANAHEDSIDIHDTKAYELAEYFRDTDVTIDFQTLDKNLVREFQQTRQVNHWSRLHPTQNIPGPSRPSILSRLGNWS